MTLCELLCKRSSIIIHSLVELLFRNIHIVYLDVEVLSSRKTISFFLDFIVGHSNREVIHSFLVLKSTDYLVNLLVTKTNLFQAIAILVFLAQFAGINQYYLITHFRVIKKEHRNIGSSVGKDIAWHGYAAINYLIVNNMLQNLVFDTALSCDESCRNNNSSLARSFLQ